MALHDDDLVIIAKIAGIAIKPVLVDKDSLSKILCLKTLEKERRMREDIKRVISYVFKLSK